jgi:DNA polymerase-3 subunit delta'
MNGSFDQFWGNASIVEILRGMLSGGRIPQTILFGGSEGIGKATLVRRFAASLLGHAELIEKDDLSLPDNTDLIEEREKWPAEKRADDPLVFGSHPDFLTFAPDGPLRQISIQQMRLMKERAQFKPLHGNHRIFLVDHLDRANEQAANSLLKLFEEPPEYLILFATAENLYDLLPTIRSRSIIFQFSRLSHEEMQNFLKMKQLPDPEIRAALAEGCPGAALSLDIAQYRSRRDLVLALLESGSGVKPFSAWVQHSEGFAAKKSEKLEQYFKPAYTLLEDLLMIRQGSGGVKNIDVRDRLSTVASRVDFAWIETATRAFDDLVLMARRNIQKIIALDAVIMDLRNQLRASNA